MQTYHTLASALAANPEEPKTLIADAARGEVWTEWPADLWKLENLQVLRINQHGIYKPVPSAIRAFQQLRVLDLCKFDFFEPGGLGELGQLRELSISGGRPVLPADITKLALDRLSITARWEESLELVAKIPVKINVTLIDGHPDAAEWLEQRDLSAWRDLQELEIDAFEDFQPTGFERKLRHCGFAINRKQRVLWEI